MSLTQILCIHVIFTVPLEDFTDLFNSQSPPKRNNADGFAVSLADLKSVQLKKSSCRQSLQSKRYTKI